VILKYFEIKVQQGYQCIEFKVPNGYLCLEIKVQKGLSNVLNSSYQYARYKRVCLSNVLKSRYHKTTNIFK